MSKEKTDSLYKILGTTAKISDKRIKEKYIQAVKRHPPETDPENFEKVRMAYETLKDPERRRQYDLKRKHGVSLEKMIDKALAEADREDYSKAEEIFKKVELINPDYVAAKEHLVYLAARTGDIELLDHYLPEALNSNENSGDQFNLYFGAALLLEEYGLIDQAIRLINEGKKQLPDYATAFVTILSKIYMDNDELEKVANFISDDMPPPEGAALEDLYLLFIWITLTDETDKRSAVSNIYSWFQKFIKNQPEEEKEKAADLIEARFDEAYESANFEEAEIYAKLLKSTGLRLHPKLKGQLNESGILAKVQKQVMRTIDDEKLFPLISLHLIEWFYEDFYTYQDIMTMKEELVPSYFVHGLENNKEGYAAGITRLRKKYPLLYKRFKSKWDKLFAELTKGFNREMKRSLK